MSSPLLHPTVTSAASARARDAFTRFDVDGSNELEKHELFQVLLELDVVRGGVRVS